MKEPWQKKGRWYKFFIESDGSNYTITRAGIEGAEVSGSYLVMPAHFHVIDAKYDIHTVGDTTAHNLSYINRMYGNGTQGPVLPEEAAFDYMTLYIFGYFDRK